LGPTGPTGPASTVVGPTGPTGATGPNNITTSTTTNLTGFLKGNGSVVSADNNTYALDNAVVKLTGNQTIDGSKSFTSTLVVGSGAYNIGIDFSYGEQQIYTDPDDILTVHNGLGPVKFMTDGGLINNGSLTTRASASVSAATQIPVFTVNPASTEQTIVTRTPAELRSDIGANNASNLTTGTLAVAQGGTGQTTLALARNAMGLGNTTGAVPIANGGTGVSSFANTFGVVYNTSTSTLATINPGTSGQFLVSNGAATPPSFQTLQVTPDRSTYSGSTLSTGSGSTTYVQLASLISIPAGSYEFQISGLMNRGGSGTQASRAFAGSITFDDTAGVTRLTAQAIFHRLDSASISATAGVGNALISTIDTVSITAGDTGTTFTTPSSSLVISNQPFTIFGTFVISQTRSFRFHIRQTAANAGNTVSISPGFSMVIRRI